jgi:hypothetical protein
MECRGNLSREYSEEWNFLACCETPPISVQYKMEKLIEFEGYEAYNEST